MREIWGQDKKIGKLLKKQSPEPGFRYKKSQFVLQFETHGKRYFYNTMTRQCLESDRDLSRDVIFSFTQIMNDPGLYKLVEYYFLVPESKDEVSFYLSIYQLMRTFEKKKGLTSYVILPTLKCNARCIYCYENGRQRLSMSSGIVDRTIRYILETRRKNNKIQFTWFGGEPLIRADVIDDICKAMMENGIDYKSYIMTNGSLINEDIIDKMAVDWRMTRVQISMDCAEQEYIARKNYYHYDNTYWRVIENIEKLEHRGIKVTVRCNYDGKNADNISAFISDLSNVLRNKTNIGIYFAPLDDFREGPEYYPFIKTSLDSQELVRREGFKSVSKEFLRLFKVCRCMADDPSRSIAIAPDGRLYPCLHCDPGTSYGDVFHGITRPEILRGYSEIGKVSEKCRDCILLPECTPFSKCPNTNYYCKETRMDSITRLLTSAVKGQKNSSSIP